MYINLDDPWSEAVPVRDVDSPVPYLCELEPSDDPSRDPRDVYEHSLIQTRMAELTHDAARDNATITKWYIDLDVSGRAEYEHKRDGLQELLSDARAGKVAVLYAREMSRIEAAPSKLISHRRFHRQSN